MRDMRKYQIPKVPKKKVGPTFVRNRSYKKLLANQDLSSKYGYMKERLTDLTASVFSFSRDLNVILSVGISFLRASQWQTHSFNTIEDKNGSLQSWDCGQETPVG